MYDVPKPHPDAHCGSHMPCEIDALGTQNRHYGEAKPSFSQNGVSLTILHVVIYRLMNMRNALHKHQ